MPLRGSYGELHRLRAEVNRLIDMLVEQPIPQASEWHPPADITEHPDAYEIQIDVPGITAESLQVEIRDQSLVVRGKKERLATEPPPDRFSLMERYMGVFVMEFEVPEAVNPTQGTAYLQQGVLRITLPKLVEKRHRTYTIPISEESEDND
jgi:HSP20 family protein